MDEEDGGRNGRWEERYESGVVEVGKEEKVLC